MWASLVLSRLLRDRRIDLAVNNTPAEDSGNTQPITVEDFRKRSHGLPRKRQVKTLGQGRKMGPDAASKDEVNRRWPQTPIDPG
jgi:hypothetical protein